MRRVAFTGSLAAVMAIVAVGASSAAAARNGFACTGTLASGSYKKITVPAGATCDGTNATVTVRGGIRVGAGATFILGSEEGTGGGKISGGLDANDPASVQLHFARVSGGVRIIGGNGFFSTVEDNVINGGATIDGYTGFWLGFIRNTVHGSTNLSNNTLGDPDANEFVTNTIRGNLVCRNNVPAPHVGDSEGSPNDVSGRKVDQCAAAGL
jgi:hypothetical protein